MPVIKNIKGKLLLVQLVSLVPLLLFIFYMLDLWTDSRRSMILERSINEAKLVAGSVEDAFLKGTYTVRTIAATSGMKVLIKNNPEVIEDTLQTITTIMDISTINISNVAGKTLFHSKELTDEQKKEVTLYDRDYFQKVLETKQPVVSDPLTGRFSESQLIIMSAPIVENEKITAVVNASYELGQLKKKLEKVLPADAKNTILLYDKNDRLAMILHKPLPEDKEKAIFNNLPFLIKETTNGIKIIENQKLPNSDKIYFGASVPVDEFGWSVVNLTSAEDSFAPLFKVQKTTWLILAAALLFALALISYVLRRIKMIY